MKVVSVYLFLIISMLTLTGCATPLPIPSFETKKGDRIGYIVEIGEGALHTHVGTTIFNNFNKKYPLKWELDSAVSEIMKNELNKSGFVAVDLGIEGISSEELSSLIIDSEEKWKYASGKEKIITNLVEDRDLKAVVIVKENRVLVALECAGGPCSERYADSSGLYTRSFFGLSQYFAVPAFNLNVYLLDPPADIASGETLREMLSIPSVPLKDYSSPDNFDQLTEEELLPVKEAILEFSRKMASEITTGLKPK
ncbi:MAG: hypothetical protein AB8D52_09055 [Gammaproteobacteria bacterium]